MLARNCAEQFSANPTSLEPVFQAKNGMIVTCEVALQNAIHKKALANRLAASGF